METLQIELKHAAESFRALYYNGDKKTVFASRKTKRLLGQTGLFGLATFTFYILSFSNNIAVVMLWIVCSLGFVVNLLLLIGNLSKYLKWKKDVDAYIRPLERYDTQLLRLTQQAIELENSDETSMARWDGFKRAAIYKTHIQLTGEATEVWLLPAASMEAHEFEALKEFVRRRMHEVKTSRVEGDGVKAGEAIADSEGPAPGADPSDGNITKC